MVRTLLSIAAVASLTAGVAALPALAQSSATAASGAMPTCAAGNPVVWVNTSSHVYHMAGDPYYGKTKRGKYECQSAAVASHAKMASTHGSSHASSTMGASPLPAVATPEAMGSPASTHHHHHHSGSSPAPDMSPGAMASPSP